MFNIEEELKKIPQKPGVYLMFNKDDKIIYVGKAINLRRRVHQYFDLAVLQVFLYAPCGTLCCVSVYVMCSCGDEG